MSDTTSRRAGIVTAAAALLVGAGVSAAAALPGPSPECLPALDGVSSGAEAIAALGSRLPAAAVGAGMSGAVFESTLRTDRSMRVDRCGRAFFVDATAAPAPQEAAAGVTSGSSAEPSGDAFVLHSRPGSKRTIFLDFNGATVAATAWNASYAGGVDIAAPGFSLDADPTTFSSAELVLVKATWLRVAEDYAPFDVDVTTADPGSAAIDRSSPTDDVYGATALITNDTTLYRACGCGGIAYIGVFNSTASHRYYQPAWVFQRGLGGASATAKNIAEAASHEVGHTLGLSHDGSLAHGSTAAAAYYRGQGSWAPIMGIGYYRPVTQWSSGDYAYANQKQDDTAIIAAHGASPVVDDHGSTAATATVLTGPAAVGGTISTRSDSDWFAFSTSGTTTVAVTPQAVGGDLDVRLEVYATTGALVASGDPAVGMVSTESATGLGASVSAALPAGSYVAKVDGVGSGGPQLAGYSDYASLGRYTISVSAPASAVPPGVTTSVLGAGAVGTTYAASLAATGGTVPYAWSLAAGSLPAGLALSAAGVLSGTPAAVGTSSFSVRVTDAASRTSTRALSIAVSAAPLTITTASMPGARLKTSYRATLAATGGTAPYSWTVSTGALPAGLSLSAAGVLSGTPTKPGTTSFTARAADAARQTSTKSFSVTVTT